MYMYKKDDPEYISLMKGCFHCSSGELLGIAQVCDGEEDCKDGSDETSHGGETHFDGCFAIRETQRCTKHQINTTEPICNSQFPTGFCKIVNGSLGECTQCSQS